jgi:hypothetical protein
LPLATLATKLSFKKGKVLRASQEKKPDQKRLIRGSKCKFFLTGKISPLNVSGCRCFEVYLKTIDQFINLKNEKFYKIIIKTP